MKKSILTALILSLTISNSYAMKPLSEKEMAAEQKKELNYKAEYFKFQKEHQFDYGVLKQTYSRKELQEMLKNKPLQRNK